MKTSVALRKQNKVCYQLIAKLTQANVSTLRGSLALYESAVPADKKNRIPAEVRELVNAFAKALAA